ncbi:MAG: hypothetical protein L3J18_00600 [Candidatus Brocadia sp.]|uniref:Uncharacterized protein n=1 Tax=Candidatus Brocadia fulgida TaxID=380242 RepID=A0A0M2UYQ5_9BACT|nr:MAG: hypothetical protein BROFUL_00532 [Candidatus Brocadia fulgida]UJS20861.1 MAG: hypothetical protein L3J18_00600 [Candidatus Brocadia sp.]
MKKPMILKQGIRNAFRATKKITLPFFLVTVVGFLGCSSREFKNGVVYKEWTRTMSEEGIFPVFPPREDVQVGDIWLLPTHPYETKLIEDIGGLGKTGIWVTNVLYELKLMYGTSTLANDFYKNRFSFPSTTEAIKNAISKDQAHLTDVSIMPVVIGNKDVFNDGDCNRLRQVAFPEFSVTNITQADVNALVPIEYLNVALGFSFNKIGQVSLKIPSAESYAIPAKLLTKTFFETNSIELGKENNFILKPYVYNSTDTVNRFQGIAGINYITLKLAKSQFDEAAKIILGDKKGLIAYRDFLWIAVINEVYYARAIDMNIRKRRFGGGAANVQPITTKMLKELDRLTKIGASKKSKITETSPIKEDTEGRTIAENIEIKEEDDAFALAKKINEYNKNLGNQSVPGGSVNVVSASDTAIGLRRFFDRPIAVGVRGIIFKVNLTKSTEKELYIESIGLN